MNDSHDDAVDVDETLLNNQCWDFVDWLRFNGTTLSAHSFNYLKPKLRDIILAHHRNPEEPK